MNLTTVYDCIGANVAVVKPPPGVLMAGYATGLGDVPWSDADWARYPDAVRFDQRPTEADNPPTADVLDVENGAASIGDVAQWCIDAGYSYQMGHRPGQRWRTVYSYESNLTPIANALNAAGIKNGVNLWLSKPMPEHAATDLLANAGGPFPIVGVQYQFGNLFDTSLVSTAWRNYVSKAPVIAAPKPGTQTGWRFCSKCQGLFWGPGQAKSVCPRGAQHDGSHSHEYTLGFAQ